MIKIIPSIVYHLHKLIREKKKTSFACVLIEKVLKITNIIDIWISSFYKIVTENKNESRSLFIMW